MNDAKHDRRTFLRRTLMGGAVIGVGGVIPIARAVAQERACGPLTDSNIEGPFYRAGAPMSADLADRIRGRTLIVTGTVRSCGHAVGSAELDFWQADPSGAYDLRGWTLRGRLRTRADGTYRLETIVPGHYLNGSSYRPAHIHVKVRAPRRAELTTQLYFDGDPYNATDPWFLPTLMLRPRRDNDVQHARFDFSV